jgi:hypothetical protein
VIDEYTYRIAQHETCHAVIAFHFGRQLDAVMISERGGTTYSSTPSLTVDLSAEEVRVAAFEAAVMVAGPFTRDPDFGSGPDLQNLGALVEKGNLKVTQVLAEAERILRLPKVGRQRRALERALLERRLISGPEAEAILELA